VAYIYQSKKQAYIISACVQYPGCEIWILETKGCKKTSLQKWISWGREREIC